MVCAKKAEQKIKPASETFWGSYADISKTPIGICGRLFGILILK